MATQRRLAGGGLLTLEEGGGRVQFHATRPQDGRGLYKVWIYGGGGRMLLGTMMPQGEELQLSRTLSRTSLLSGGCYPVAGGEVVMAFPFHSQPEEKELPSGWMWVDRVEELNWDGLLRSAVEDKKFLRKNDSGGFTLASHYDARKEFPLVPLFCLCRWEKLGDIGWLMWDFDENGRPIVGHNC